MRIIVDQSGEASRYRIFFQISTIQREGGKCIQLSLWWRTTFHQTEQIFRYEFDCGFKLHFAMAIVVAVKWGSRGEQEVHLTNDLPSSSLDLLARISLY